MKKNKDLSRYQIHTDLAVERFSKKVKNNNYNKEQIKDLTVITNYLNSKSEIYMTIEFVDITDEKEQKKVTEVFTSCFKKLLTQLKIKKSDKCLIIGLGNSKSTPDSLGPNVIDGITVTSHLFSIDSFEVDKRYRNVMAIAPGVTARTGLETSEFINAVIEKTKPDFLIIIDALIAKSLSRLNKIIQLSNAGFCPGGVLGNFRKELNTKNLGLPIISIGVPTVVDAKAIINDTLDYFHKVYPDYKDLKSINNMSEIEIKRLFKKVLSSLEPNLMVTSKEIDFIIKKLVKIITDGLNSGLHNNK